ncbi:hypothetical protein PLESTF_001798900 [Pleodorina starrii]|nr:hypothetical protein PLESTF_001798900 [Pleodorina starrii]
MGLRRMAVASPCLTHLAVSLLQPASAHGRNWWLWPLVSAVLAFTNQDTAEVTAVQSSLLYTYSVTAVAVDFARKTWLAAPASAAAAASAAPLRPGLFSQLMGRVAALAALHAALAASGIWVGASGRRRAAASQRRGPQPQVKPRGPGPREQSDWGPPLQDSAAVRPKRLLVSESGYAAATAAAPGAQADGPDLVASASVGSARGPPGNAATIAADCDSVPTLVGSFAETGPASTAEAGAADAQLQAWNTQQQQQQSGVMTTQAPCQGWHDDFPTEGRHVVATRLADAALLAYDFLEASRCFCATAALRGGVGGMTFLGAEGSGPGAALPRWLGAAAAGGGSGSDATLRQLRCLGALLVTSWGATVLIMNAILILWPRPRRFSYAWIVNSACSWLAGLARAALLVLMAPPRSGPAVAACAGGPAAAAPPVQTAGWPRLALDDGSGSGDGRSGFQSPTGQPALEAAVVLLTHLIASNLSPGVFGIQSAAAAAAGALLHRRLEPASPAAALAVVYGGVWLAAVALLRALTRACRPLRAQNSATATVTATAAAADGTAAADDELTAAVLTAAPSSITFQRLQRPPPPRLGPVVNHTASSADGASPGSAAAASDLALRTLSHAGSLRLSGMGQQPQQPQPYLRSHSGASSCSNRAQEQPPLHGRAGSVGSQASAFSGAGAAAPGAAATSSFEPVLRGAGRPASGEPAAPSHRRPPPPPLQMPKRSSLDSQVAGSRLSACRGPSPDPNPTFFQRNPSAAAAAAAALSAQPVTAATGFADGCSPFGGALPCRLSRCGRAQPAGKVVSYMRRAASERPTGLERPAAAHPPSFLQYANSCGPQPAQARTGMAAAAPPGAPRAVAAGAWLAAAPTPAAPAAAAPAWAGRAAGPAAHSSGGGGSGEELAGTMGRGPAAPPARMLAPMGPAPLAAGGGGGGAAAANDHSVLSSVILEADMYDRLLSSASSPFLLNTGNANAPTTARLPSLANTGTLTLASSLTSPTLAHGQQQPKLQQQQQFTQLQQQQMQQQWTPTPFSYNQSSSSLSETWSAAGGAAGQLAGAASGGGGGAFALGAAAAAAAAGFGVPPPAHRRNQMQGSDGEDFELCSGDMGPRSGGGGGGESGWGRPAAPGTRSRLDRVPVPVPVPVVAAEEAAPRQIIVLADGRQVYQSELLAATAGASPTGSATPLRNPAANGAVVAERTRQPAGRDLLGFSARSEPSAQTVGLAAAPTPGAAVSRHLSYTITRGGGPPGGGHGADGLAGGSGALSSSLDPLSSSLASYSPYSTLSGPGGPREDQQGGAGEAGRPRHVTAAPRSGRSSWQPPPPPELQRVVSLGVTPAATAAAPPPPPMYGSGGGAATAWRSDRGFGFGQPSPLGSSVSGRSSYARRGGGGGDGGGTSASSPFSGSYGPVSGGAFTMGGTSGTTSYGTAETGGSLSGGGSAATGASGGGTVSNRRASLELGRHLHDTGLIRIGEEEAILEDDEDERPTSTLFGTCDGDGDGGDGSGLGISLSPSGVGERLSYNGFSVGYGSESQSDRRSSAIGRPSNGTASSEAPPALRRGDMLPGSYCSSSVGSGATGGEAPGHSAPLATRAAAGAGPSARVRRGRARAGRGGSPPQQLLQPVLRVQGASSVTCGGGGGDGSVGLPGSGTSGASYRDLSDPPSLQTLLQPPSHTVSSSSGILPHLPLLAAGAAAAAAAAAASAAGGFAAAVHSGRYMGSGGGSQLSSSNPSLLSFADVTLGFNLAPASASAAAVAAAVAAAASGGPVHNTGSHSHGNGLSAATVTLSGAGVLVTLSRGVLAVDSPVPSSGVNTAGVGGDNGGGPAAARRLGAAAASGGAAAGGVPSDGAAGSSSLRFLAYPQTLAPMAGSGSIGRGSHTALRAVGAAALSGTTAVSTASGAAPRVSSSGRLGFLAGGAGAGEARAGSRPNIPELLASTAAAAAAVGNASGYGTSGSPWASSASSAAPLRDAGSVGALPPLPPPSPPAGASGGFAVAKQSVGMRTPHRLNLSLFTADEGSSGVDHAAAAAAATEGCCSTAAGSHPTGDILGGGPRASSAAALALPSHPLSSQPLSTGDRRRGRSWFGHFLTPRRPSMIGAGGADTLQPLPSAPPAHQQHHYGPIPAAAAGGSNSGGGEVHELHDGGRLSAAAAVGGAAGRSSQQLTRLMDDTARLSPVRGVLQGLRKRIRSGVKSLSGGR